MTTALASHTTPEVRSLLGDPLLHELSHGLRGPYHVLFPERFDTNAAAFRETFAEAGVDGRVYYAKKANKAAVYAQRAAVAGLGVDVASQGELREALAAGVRGEDLVVTGPAKADDLLRVAVLQGALIAVDALDELDRLLSLADELGRTARVVLRRLPRSSRTAASVWARTSWSRPCGAVSPVPSTWRASASTSPATTYVNAPTWPPS